MSKNVSLGTTQYAIIALAAITGIIHLFLGISFCCDTLSILFILNGIGFLDLVGAYYFGGYISPKLVEMRSQIRWVLIAFTAVTIVAYLVMNFGAFSPLGLFTKAVEVALIVLLLRE